MTRISIPTPLRSYTNERREVTASGATLDDLLRDLDRQYPGIRFRMVDEQESIRPHVRMWLNLSPVRDLATPVRDADELVIIQALSGG